MAMKTPPILGILLFGLMCIPKQGFSKEDVNQRPLRIPLTQIPVSIDPHEGNFVARNKITKQIFDNLVRLDSNAAPVASISKAWKVDRKNKSIIFQITSELLFHDGAPVTASSVRKSLIRTIEKKGAIVSQIKGASDCNAKTCSSIDLPSKDSVRMFLEQHTYDLFLKALASTDAAIVKVKGNSVIGSGPFQIKSKTDDRIVIKRRVTPPTSNHVSEIHYLKVPESEAVNAYLSGKVDELWSNTLEEEQQTKRKSHEVKFSFYGTYLFALNIHSGVFSHQPVRAAVSMALDPQMIMKSLGRSGAAATGFIPLGLLGHTKITQTVDADQAKKLVESTLPDPNDRFLKVVLHESYRSKAAFVKYLETVLRKIGLRPKIVFMQFTPALKAMKAKKVDMLLKADSVQHYDSSTIFTPLLSDNFANINHYSNQKLDEAVSGAQSAPTTSERKRFLQSAESVLTKDIPIIPIFYPRRQSYYSSDIETGLKPQGEIRYWEFPYRDFRWVRK